MVRKSICIITYGIIVLVLICFVSFGNKAVTVFVENQPMPRKHCIVIDPGHGGMDGGASSRNGTPESKYNLDISLCLNDLLHFLGYQTKMIRTEDTSVSTEGETIAQKKISDLKNRVKIVSDTENAILLSIHQNFFTQEQYSGAQVFYADTSGSKELASEIQSSFIQTVNLGSNRESKKSEGIYIMERVPCPAVLIECGFLSNLQEEEKLRNPIYQKKICAVIGTALSRYLSNT